MESPIVPGGSGIGPERALEAITLTPRARRESPCSRELPCKHRTDSAEPPPTTQPPSPDPQRNLTPHIQPIASATRFKP